MTYLSKPHRSLIQCVTSGDATYEAVQRPVPMNVTVRHGTVLTAKPCTQSPVATYAISILGTTLAL